MAKPKARRGTPEPPPRKGMLTVRGSDEWREWVAELVAHSRIKLSDVIDLALVEYAANHGFKRKAPKR